MKIKIEFEGDSYEDRPDIKMIIHSQEMHNAIFDAQQLIRTRLKYGENVTDIEEQTLESIREALYLGWDD